MEFIMVLEKKDRRSKDPKLVIRDLLCPTFDTSEEAISKIPETKLQWKLKDDANIKIYELAQFLEFCDGKQEKLIDYNEIKI